MDPTILKSGRDSMLIAIPCIAMLFVGLFRLDELIERPNKSATWARRRSARGIDEQQQPILSDPDGRVPERE